MGPQQSKHTDDHLQPPQAQYIVLRSADIDTSAKFFSLLGFNPVKERHGDGPEHFSFTIHGALVYEIYPWNKETTPPSHFARFGFLVPDLAAIRSRLEAAQISIIRESTLGADREWILVLDPDGNQIELFEHPEIR